jgi:hypothetical protein
LRAFGLGAGLITGFGIGATIGLWVGVNTGLGVEMTDYVFFGVVYADLIGFWGFGRDAEFACFLAFWIAF